MDFAAERARLIAHLKAEIKDERVLAAMGRIPRECFVPPESERDAYEDGPLPIGYNQTISQPLIIALMTVALGLKGSEKVLEVGTGSGYQTAILAELARQVLSVERIQELLESARKILTTLGYSNVELHLAEKTLGWRSGVPYDAIIVTAGAPCIPTDLLAQLAIGGRMVIPVGTRFVQELYKITRLRDKNKIENLGGCRFVPLVGDGAWEKEE